MRGLSRVCEETKGGKRMRITSGSISNDCERGRGLPGVQDIKWRLCCSGAALGALLEVQKNDFVMRSLLQICFFFSVQIGHEKSFFSGMVIRHCKGLPGGVVELPDSEVFKDIVPCSSWQGGVCHRLHSMTSELFSKVNNILRYLF